MLLRLVDEREGVVVHCADVVEVVEDGFCVVGFDVVGGSRVGIIAAAAEGVPVAGFHALCDLDDDVRSRGVGCVDFLVVGDLAEVAWREGAVSNCFVKLAEGAQASFRQLDRYETHRVPASATGSECWNSHIPHVNKVCGEVDAHCPAKQGRRNERHLALERRWKGR